MDRIVLKSRVGSNGILELTVPVGAADADREVQATVEAVGVDKLSQEEWRQRTMELAGSWEGNFERPEHGELQERDPLQL